SELADRGHAVVLADVGAGLGRLHGEATDEARGLEQPVPRMEHRPRVPERRVDPLGVEAVLVEELELAPQLVTLLLVLGQAQAPRAAERISAKRFDLVERVFGAPPERRCPLAADRLGADIVR